MSDAQAVVPARPRGRFRTMSALALSVCHRFDCRGRRPPLPFPHRSQLDSDDLLALPARCPMSLAVAAASSRWMFCRWASGGVALNRGRGRLQASRCLRATSIATVASRSGAPSRRLRSSRRGRGPARDARTNRDRNQPAVRCSFASRSLPARHRTRRKNMDR